MRAPLINTLGLVGLLLGTATAATAQPVASPTTSIAPATPAADRWEFRIASGTFIPTGDLRHSLEDADVTAAQLSWLVRPGLAITGSFAWARSRDMARAEAPRLDVFTTDLGLESRTAERRISRRTGLTAFAGVGAGARTYNHRRLEVDATNNVAAYASGGGELGIGRVGLRVEARDYASRFTPLAGAGRAQARNDMVVLAALRFDRRSAPETR